MESTSRQPFQTVPGPVSGPLPVGGQSAGFHTAAPARGLLGAIQVGTGAGILLLCGACTVATGNRNAGTFTYASLAGDAKFGEFGPEGMRNAEINNSNGAGVIERTADKIGNAWMWGKAWEAAGDISDDLFGAAEDANATDVQINKQDNAAKVKVETFVPPEPVVTPP